MTTQLNIDPDHTGVLVLHYQNEIVGGPPVGWYFTRDQAQHMLDRAAAVLAGARQAGIPIIYEVLRFREGHPEIGLNSSVYGALKGSGRLREGTQGAEIHSRVAPQPGEVLVTGRRSGAFTGTDMDYVVKAKGITNLVLMGVATSGVVLSTVQQATDADYDVMVLEDCCADRDSEVHRVLTQKVFPDHVTVINSQEFLQAIGRA